MAFDDHFAPKTPRRTGRVDHRDISEERSAPGTLASEEYIPTTRDRVHLPGADRSVPLDHSAPPRLPDVAFFSAEALPTQVTISYHYDHAETGQRVEPGQVYDGKDVGKITVLAVARCPETYAVTVIHTTEDQKVWSLPVDVFLTGKSNGLPGFKLLEETPNKSSPLLAKTDEGVIDMTKVAEHLTPEQLIIEQQFHALAQGLNTLTQAVLGLCNREKK